MASEKRLIDANALKSNMCEYCNKYFSEEPCEPSECVFIQFVNEQPTVDAVEVVRCKDCKHCTPDENIVGGYGDCFYKDDIHSIVSADDFCSYGERRDDERNC